MSKPVIALIAADLCINILLGLPFLKHNRIVIDHDAADTAIGKTTGFDLLNENKLNPLIVPPPHPISPKHKCDTILCARWQVLKELKWRCAERRQTLELKNMFETCTPINYIASIKNTIQHLASKQELLNL